MSDQLALTGPPNNRQEEVEREFWQFHRAHFEVFQAFSDEIGIQLFSLKKKYISARDIIGVLRARYAYLPGINNNFIAYYARIYCEMNPGHAKYFRLKPLKSANKRPWKSYRKQAGKQPRLEYQDNENQGPCCVTTTGGHE